MKSSRTPASRSKTTAKLFCVAGSFQIACLNSFAWPTYVDLQMDESQSVQVRTACGQIRNHTLTVTDVQYHYAPNHSRRIPEKYGRRHLQEAVVTLNVDGKAVVLRQRAYEFPLEFNGLRLYVENTRRWAEDASFMAVKDLAKDVRLAVAVAGESWGPPNMLFPLLDYRWGSSVYQNTWGSLVPYNSLYYHRGEDFGAIPDRLSVRAVLEGAVVATPLPAGDGKSNEIVLQHTERFTSRVSHVNVPWVDARIRTGATVARGQHMARTGNTYKRAGAQYRDPHLHINFNYDGHLVSTYPYLVEAYLRDNPDTLIAIAGGYAYTLPGEPVELDATRTIVRQGHAVASFQWKLHDGRVIDEPKASVCYKKPGLYTEELIVKTADGDEDRDFLQVRVIDPAHSGPLAYGWAYHSPIRGLKPGAEVLFWSRLANTRGKVMIDFGDGSPAVAIDKELRYRYSAPGRYTVSLNARGAQGDPVTVKMEVVVEAETPATP